VRLVLAIALAGCSFRHGIGPDGGETADAARTRDGAVIPDAPTGSIAATRQLVTGPTDLTGEGAIDWAEWGATKATDFNHKATGGTQIANCTEVGSGTVFGYGNAYNQAGNDGFTWSDGTPVMNEPTAQYSGLWIDSAPNGFSTHVPADPTTRTLRMYVGAYDATGTFTAHLTDGSAPDYVDANGIGNTTTSWAARYEVVYRSATAGAALTITWVQSSAGGGDVNWSAASLH